MIGEKMSQETQNEMEANVKANKYPNLAKYGEAIHQEHA